jgi:hypothetical protein
LRERIYVNLLFYVGNADYVLKRAKEELERRGLNILIIKLNYWEFHYFLVKDGESGNKES